MSKHKTKHPGYTWYNKYSDWLNSVPVDSISMSSLKSEYSASEFISRLTGKLERGLYLDRV